MKRIVCIFLAACLLLLPSCFSQANSEQAFFYYCRTEYVYDAEDSIIVSESRDISGHVEDLRYLLSMYLLGPLDETLRSPFPVSTKLLSLYQKEQSLFLEISNCSEHLSDSEFSMACACLALTCLDLTDANDVTITSGDQKITLSENSLLLYDNIEFSTDSTEETK